MYCNEVLFPFNHAINHQNHIYHSDSPPPIVSENNRKGVVGVTSCLQDDFKLKYIPEEKLSRIVNHVQRNKRKQEENKQWMNYLDEKKEKECRLFMGYQRPEPQVSYIQKNQVTEFRQSQFQTDQLQNSPPYFLQNKATAESQGTFQECDEEVWTLKGSCGLQTIPEEQTICSTKECLISTDCNNSLSGEVAVTNETVDINKEKCHQEFDICSDNISSDLSTYTYLDGSKDSIHYRKIKNHLKKMCSTLDNISRNFSKIPEPDGVQDLLRRQQRAAEFSSRFGRNYIYPLQRQLHDIRKQVKGSLTCVGARHTLHVALCQKMVCAHNTAFRGLQACLHHMPSSVANCLPDKLRTLLRYVLELSKLNVKLGITPNGGKSYQESEIERKCKIILSQMKPKMFDDAGSESFATTSHISIYRTNKGRIVSESSILKTNKYFTGSQTSIHKTNRKDSKKNDALLKKLSMYAPKFTPSKAKINWDKKRSAALAKEKFGSPPKQSCVGSVKESVNVKSKKQCTTANGTQDVPKRPPLNLNGRVKSFEEISPGDDVKTMMDLIPPEDVEEEILSEVLVEPHQPQVCFDPSENDTNKFDEAKETVLMTELLKVARELSKQGNQKNKKQPEAGDVLVNSPETPCKDQFSYTELHVSQSSHLDMEKAEAAVHQLQILLKANQMKPEDIKTIIENMNHSLSLLKSSEICNKNAVLPHKNKHMIQHNTPQQNREQYNRETTNMKMVSNSHVPLEEHQGNKTPLNNKAAEDLISAEGLPQGQNYDVNLNMPRKGQKALISSPSGMIECSSVKHQHEKQNLKRNRYKGSEVTSNWEPNVNGKLYEWNVGRGISSGKKSKTHLEYTEDQSKEQPGQNKHKDASIASKKQNNSDKNSALASESIKPTKSNHNNEPDNTNSVKSKFKVHPVSLTLSSVEETMSLNYKKRFHHYKNTKNLYMKPKKPWLMVSRLADQLVEDNFEEVIVNDTGINILAKQLFELEFK